MFIQLTAAYPAASPYAGSIFINTDDITSVADIKDSEVPNASTRVRTVYDSFVVTENSGSIMRYLDFVKK